MRKSPFKHHVKSHIRSGKRVHDYDRGKGKQPKKLANPMMNKTKKSDTNHTVIIKYNKSSSEKIQVNAKNHPNAIDKALNMRKSTEFPMLIEVINH